MLAKGRVSLYAQRPGSRAMSLMSTNGNLIVDEAADVLAGMVSGDYRISEMFVHYKNGTVSSPTEPAAGDAIGLYSSLPAQEDYIVVPILAAPLVFASTSDRSGNAATFMAPTDAAASLAGEANGNAFTDGSSNVFSLGLVATSKSGGPKKLFSRVITDPVVTKEAGVILVAHWTITFS